MEILIAILASVLAVALLVIIAQVIVIVKLTKKQAEVSADAVKVKKGVRYSESERVITLDGKTQVTHRPEDVVLVRGQTYTVGKKNKILPGQYTVLAAAENTDSFTISVNGAVQTYQHNSHLVLADGAQISPRSADIILR